MSPETAQLGGPAKALVYICLAVYALWSMFPIFWVMLISFKASAEALSVPPQLIFTPTLAELPTGFSYCRSISERHHNSVIIAAVGTCAILVLAVPAAYGLSRLLPLGRDTMSFSIISARTFPTIGLAIPLFLFMQNADLLDTHASVIIANVAYSLPFGIWMIFGFLEIRSRSSLKRRLSSTAAPNSARWCGLSFHSCCPESARPRS